MNITITKTDNSQAESWKTNDPRTWTTEERTEFKSYRSRLPVEERGGLLTKLRVDWDEKHPPLPEGKIRKWGVEITSDCPGYYINKKLANCRDITPNESRCLGLLNVLMKKYGYAFVGNEQLAHWLGLNHPVSAENMLRKLRKGGFIKDNGKHHGKHRWVVCDAWQNPKNGTASAEAKDEPIPF